jgi:tRNA(Ile2) C34 agmatinyltransferase TiaS
MNSQTQTKSKKDRFSAILVLKEADRLLEITAAYANTWKSHLPLKLAKCPRCGVLLLQNGQDSVKCPACNTVYRLALA